MTTLFFIHGMWSTPRVWDNYRAHFQSLGYRTIAPALVQHFSSNQAKHVQNLSLLDYVDQLEEEYRAAEKQHQNIVLVGHSMGGLLAQLLASRVNCKALVLLASAPPAGLLTFHPEPAKVLSGVFCKPFFWKNGVKLSYRTARHGIFNALTETEAKTQYERLCFESGQAIREVTLWYTDPKRASSVDPEKIDCPVMNLVGEHDRIVPPSSVKKLSRYLGASKHFQQLSHFGHMLPIEDKNFAIAKQIHVWLCWQLGTQSSRTNEPSKYTATNDQGLYTATS
jgi:pimeloyl-ACP methyl ester carboxylesterase